MKKNTHLIYVIIIALLLGLSVYLLINNKKTKTENEEITSENNEMTEENNDLIIQLQSLDIQYEDLNKEYGELSELFESEQSKVRDLMEKVRQGKVDINSYKKQISSIRKQLSTYKEKIEELEAKNMELTSENINLEIQLDSVKKTNVVLQQQVVEKEIIIKQGSKLLAYNIVPVTMKSSVFGKEVITTKAKKVEKVIVRFTLSENSLVESGEKEIYLRIADPNGKIFAGDDGEDVSFMFENEELLYTIKANIEYDQKKKELIYTWTPQEKLEKGEYYIDIFMPDNKIGTTNFVLE